MNSLTDLRELVDVVIGVDTHVHTHSPTNTQPGQQLPGPLVAGQTDPVDQADDPTAVPDQTKDDTDAGWGEQSNLSAHDRWLLEQRPPHWGRD